MWKTKGGFVISFALTNSLILIPAVLSACSSSPCPRAQPDQPQSNGHPGLLAAPSRQAESWESHCLPLVLSYQCRERSLSGGAPRRENAAPPGKPAARHHLPAAYCRCHQCRVGWAVCLDVSPHSKGIQCSRFGRDVLIINGVAEVMPCRLCRHVIMPVPRDIWKKKKRNYDWTLLSFISWERVKNRICSNNLVNALRLVLCDPCPALSVTLEGLQSWVIKRASQASGWERVYGHLGPHLKLWGGGRENLLSLPISAALWL